MRLMGENTLPRTIWPTVRVGALGTVLVRPLPTRSATSALLKPDGGIGVGLGHAVTLPGALRRAPSQAVSAAGFVCRRGEFGASESPGRVNSRRHRHHQILQPGQMQMGQHRRAQVVKDVA